MAVAIACFTEGIILPVIAILLSLLQLILYRQEERKRASEQSPSHPAGTDQEVPIPLYRLQQGSHIWN
ncbi:hypothetical protein [Arcticibacter sp. MXS-1]|uniref:hypothetical protein n=1 Tax=Arcticibacter sp. MXS-1 TaxID=3341726 RepID=UPI0035A8C347